VERGKKGEIKYTTAKQTRLRPQRRGRTHQGKKRARTNENRKGRKEGGVGKKIEINKREQRRFETGILKRGKIRWKNLTASNRVNEKKVNYLKIG